MSTQADTIKRWESLNEENTIGIGILPFAGDGFTARGEFFRNHSANNSL